MVLCDTFSKDIKFTNHNTDWLHFRCYFGFGENNGSAVKGPAATARCRLSPKYSRPLATNPPEKLTAGRPFWCPYRNLEIYRYHRAQENKLQKGKELKSK